MALRPGARSGSTIGQRAVTRQGSETTSGAHTVAEASRPISGKAGDVRSVADRSLIPGFSPDQQISLTDPDSRSGDERMIRSLGVVDGRRNVSVSDGVRRSGAM
jgi:hypothetical protein